MPLAWSYSRVSRGTQAGADRSGLERQEQALQHWLAEHPDWELAESLVDPGVSAGEGKHRTTGALSRFLQGARTGAVPPGSCLVVESMSRFSREAERQVLGVLLSDFWAAGLAIAFCSDGGTVLDADLIDREPHRLHGLLGAMAQARREWEEKSRRSRGAAVKRHQLQDQGAKVAAATPWWIARDADRRLVRDTAGNLQLDPACAATLRRAAELAIGGLGSTLIAQQLNDEGHSPPPTRNRRNQYASQAGSAWNHSRVTTALRSPALVGDLQRQGGSVVEGFYPAVLSRAQWEHLRAAMATRDTLRGQLRGGSQRLYFLFQTICRCVCGAPMSYHRPGRGARADHPGWVGCRTCNRRDSPGHGKGYVLRDQMEAHCLTRLSQGAWAELLADPDARQERQRLAEQVAALRHRVAQSQAQMESMERRASDIWSEGAGEERLATVERAITQGRVKLHQLKHELTEQSAALRHLEARPDEEEAGQELAARVKEFWQQLDQATPQERRAFNRWLLLHPARIRFVVDPPQQEGADRLVALHLGNRCTGRLPLAGTARLMAKKRGLVDPARALQTGKGTASLVLLGEPGQAQLLELTDDGAVEDQTALWRSGPSLRGLTRVLEQRLPTWLQQEGYDLTPRQLRRFALQMAARELGLDRRG